MYEGKVIKSFVDKRTRKLYTLRQTYRSDDLERMQELAKLGRVAFRPPDGPPDGDPDPAPDADKIRHVGGGYWELPNGERIKGKAEALARLAELEAAGEDQPSGDGGGPGANDPPAGSAEGNKAGQTPVNTDDPKAKE